MTDPVDAEYARRYSAAKHGGFVEHVRETCSRQGREVLAIAASDGKLDVSEILRAFSALEDRFVLGSASERIQSLEPRAVLDLGRVLASAGTRDDKASALTLLLGVAAVHGSDALDQESRLSALLLMAELQGEHAVARQWQRWVTGSEPTAELALLRATARAAQDGPDERWLEAVNTLYALEDTTALELMGDEPEAMRRLVPAAYGGPGPCDAVISVLMMPGKGDPGLTYRCLELGDWGDIEVLNWDGGPPPSIRGDACLVVRKGDWLHPSLLPRLMARLDRRLDLPAVTSRRAEITANGQFIITQNGMSLIEKSQDVSLIRNEAIEYLSTQWSGPVSAEAITRMVGKVSGVKIPSATRLPLVLSSESHGAPTAVRKIVKTPERVGVEVLKTSAVVSRSLSESLSSRSDPVLRPQNRFRETQRSEALELDIVYATDLRFPGGNTSVTIDEIKAATGAGFRVGILPMTSALIGPQRNSSRRLILEIARSGGVVIDYETKVRTALCVVRHPTTVQYEDTRTSNIEAQRLLLVANQVPRLRDGGQVVYEPARARLNASRLFNTEAELVPESETTRRALGEVDPSLRLTSFGWPGIVDVSRFKAYQPSKYDRPRLGRHSRDNRLKWPDAVEDIYAAYDSPRADVAILGGVESLKGEVSSKVLNRWYVYPFGSMPVEKYLAGIDIWVYFFSSQQTESFGLAALEAMAAGCTVVLDPSLSTVFGDLACYSSPEMVPEIVMKWRDDREDRESRRRRISAAVDAEFGYASYGERLRSVMELK